MKKQVLKVVRAGLLSGLFLMILGFQQSYAQQTVTGTVSDEQGPIPGANIIIQGTSNGVTTDFDGNYTIEASPEDVLVISYIGYATQEIPVGDQSTIDVTLQTDQQELDEVVVIGYGTVKKSDVTGAVSRVDSKSFEDQPVTRAEEALQGRAAGVTVSRSSGAPGGGVKVRVRGVNSITGNNDPLVVIDGVLGGDLSTINPNDIASMDVLKDASATAIYGVRGSNGVIIISTKKGSGEGEINLEYFTSVNTVPELLPTLAESPGDFARIENERRTITGGNPIFTESDIAALEAQGGTNYQDEILRTGISKVLQISASGSEGKLRYFLSGNYRDEEGIVINNGYQQLNLRSNLDAQVTERLKLGLNIFASRGETKNNFETFGNGQGSLIFKANTWDPTTPIFNDEGLYNLRSNRGIGSLNLNPIYTLRESDFRDVDEQLNATLNLTYDITDNLSFNMIAGSQLNNYNIQRYAVEGPNPIPDASFNNFKTTQYQISNILTWQKLFGADEANDLKITGVQEYTNIKNVNNGYNANDLALPNGFYFAELAPIAGQSVNNNFGERELSSFMLRGEYIFDQSLFLTVTGRYDGTSVFREGQKWGFFPSVALAYSFNSLIENSETISALKLRAGWGQVGNQGVNNFDTFARLGVNTYAYDGNSAQPGTTLDGFANPDLTWETTTQTNVGIDVGVLQGRGNITLDGYRKTTTDLLLNVPVPTTLGGGTIVQNVGEVENYGIDLALGYDIVATDNANWSSNIAFSYIQNEVTKLFGGLDEIEGQFTAPGGQNRRVNVIQLGEPIGQFSGATFLGTWKSDEQAAAEAVGKKPGDAKYLRGEDGEIVFGAIGNGTPEYIVGWNNIVSYKNWDFNFFLQGIFGFDVYNIMQAGITGGAGDSRSFLASYQVNQWTPQNETDIPNTVQLFDSSNYVEKGDFVRLSNLTLGYTLPDILGEGTSIKIYGGGQNLFLITGYSGYDPENTSVRTDQGNQDVAPGINVGAYPNPRTYTLGLRVGF